MPSGLVNSPPPNDATDASEALIHVYLITYRRPLLFKRALASVLEQTYRNILVKIINDDPDDKAVFEIVSALNHPRVSIFSPCRNRGPTANFNIAFSDTKAPFVSVLEDDNWWEPQFLEVMHKTLLQYPEARAAVSNELIWKEMSDGSWLNTGTTIRTDSGVHLYEYDLVQIATAAIFCNSATLLRTDAALQFETPGSIPVDVTESFRELLLDRPIVLVGSPLANFAVTIRTARSSRGDVYTCLSVGSVFVALSDVNERRVLAKRLWDRCCLATSPRAMVLVMTGIYVREARALLKLSPMRAKVRFVVWLIRHPLKFFSMSQMNRIYVKELQFLVQAPLMQRLVKNREIKK
jgi:glycosyltransferase involved in cell wall biosynthesis